MSDDKPSKHIKRPLDLDELIATLRRYAQAPRRPAASLLVAERLAYKLFPDTTNIDPSSTRH